MSFAETDRRPEVIESVRIDHEGRAPSKQGLPLGFNGASRSL